VKPAPFELHAPESVDDAVELLAAHGDEAKVLAGGQSLVPMLALRLARFEHLVDVNRVDGLSAITRSNGSLRVGATARHAAVERGSDAADAVPLLSRATAKVGHFQIRNRGTLGGAIAHADPAAEQPAVAVALDAVMEVRSKSGTRELPASDFFEGTWTTSLADDELLTAVRFPVWEGRCGFAVDEIARRSGDFALVGVVCGVGLGGSGVDRAAIALFGVGATPIRATTAEQALREGAGDDEVAAAVMRDIDPIDDLHASADYRRKVAGVITGRALARAREEAERA
jgi:aerobic carbon-monoxide dehydrogenase medium subunit